MIPQKGPHDHTLVSPDTLVVNLFGGPGISKSTTAAYVFAKLKSGGVNAEYVPEFAKDLTWEERHNALMCQPYIFGKQLFRIQRLVGKVDVIVTDSPILLCALYGANLGDHFKKFVWETHRRFNNLNIFLMRHSGHHPYVQKGRRQTEAEAIALDSKIWDLLWEGDRDAITVPVERAEDTAAQVQSLILETKNVWRIEG